MNHETAPISPIAFGAGSDAFYTLNQPGSGTLEVRLATLTRKYESPAGPGLVSIATGDRWLLSFNEGQNALSRVDLQALPTQPNFEHVAPCPRRSASTRATFRARTSPSPTTSSARW